MRIVRIAFAILGAIVLSVGVRADQRVTGQWRIEFATPLGQRGANLTIVQAQSKLTGHVVDEYGEYRLTGRSADADVVFTWSVPEHGTMLEITAHGTIDGNVITGTVKLGDVGDGPFTARRTGDAN